MAGVAGAESEKQQVVDELLVLGHAESLRREPGSHVEVAGPQGFVSDVFRYEYKDNINLMILFDFFSELVIKIVFGQLPPGKDGFT